MTVPPEELDRVAREGRRRRRLSRRDRKRAELAPVVDTGMLDDDDIDALYDAFQSGVSEPQLVVMPDADV